MFMFLLLLMVVISIDDGDDNLKADWYMEVAYNKTYRCVMCCGC